MPLAGDQGCGSITMESMLYLYGLTHAAELAEYVGRTGIAEEYQKKAETLKKAILDNCICEYNGTELIQDGPGVDIYSVHSQVFAILNNLVSPEQGKKMLEVTVGNPELAQSSVSFMFYLFRALEKCGWYEKTDELWNLWRKMLENNLTTCVENDTDERSDCHAWASLMCYELPSVVLGVRPASPGYKKVSINPQMANLTFGEGNVITPKGYVRVKWRRRDDGGYDLQYSLPEGMTKC